MDRRIFGYSKKAGFEENRERTCVDVSDIGRVDK